MLWHRPSCQAKGKVWEIYPNTVSNWWTFINCQRTVSATIICWKYLGFGTLSRRIRQRDRKLSSNSTFWIKRSNWSRMQSNMHSDLWILAAVMDLCYKVSLISYATLSDTNKALGSATFVWYWWGIDWNPYVDPNRNPVTGLSQWCVPFISRHKLYKIQIDVKRKVPGDLPDETVFWISLFSGTPVLATNI